MKKLILIIGMLSMMSCNCIDNEYEKYEEYQEWCDELILIYHIKATEVRRVGYCEIDSIGNMIDYRRRIEDYYFIEIRNIEQLGEYVEIEDCGIVPKPVSFELQYRAHGKRDKNPTFDKFMKWRNKS